MTLRVLIVGAQADREAMTELLRMRGYDAHAASTLDWRSAVQRVHPDVVLVDVAVPGIEGRDALRMLRSIAPDARLILMTPRPNRQLADAGVACLCKPIDLASLERALRTPMVGAWCTP